MFRAILSSVYLPKHCFTCLVGDENRPTIAHFRVDGPEGIVKAVLDMANTPTGRGPIDVDDPTPVSYLTAVKDLTLVDASTPVKDSASVEE